MTDWYNLLWAIIWTDKGVYNTDVIDTDHSSWLILLHCSDPESEKKFLSTFILSRTPYMDKLQMDYLREKVAAYGVNLEYLFPVNQTFCNNGEQFYAQPEETTTTTTTSSPIDEEEDQDLYFAEDSDSNNSTDGFDGEDLVPISEDNTQGDNPSDDKLQIYPE